MKVLIVGGNGMIGHAFLQSWQSRHNVKVTLRKNLKEYQPYGLYSADNSFSNVDIFNIDLLENLIQEFKPDCVVNCVGLTKQLINENDTLSPLLINSAFPHQLLSVCRKSAVRLIHLSTDCVYSGEKGLYSEKDVPDAEDIYGRTKILGEISQDNSVTIRKSTIGQELDSSHGLIEWLLNQKGSIRGYTKAIYSGFPSSILAGIVENVMLDHKDLKGIWHISSSPISKYDLLEKLVDRLDNFKIDIMPDDKIKIDRSLDSSKFLKKTGYEPPSWDFMIDNLAKEINEKRYDHR